MDSGSVGLLIAVLISLYPVYLVWRFLTLGIKAFKKYLYGNEYQYLSDDEDDS